MGQPCYEDKIQELNTDFSKICISPKPSGAPMGKVPLPVLKELEHQARQNLSTVNFMAVFAKTSSSCNSTLENCQHSLKSSFKKVKTPSRKVPILKKQPGVVTNRPVSIWRFGSRSFLSNKEHLYASANL